MRSKLAGIKLKSRLFLLIYCAAVLFLIGISDVLTGTGFIAPVMAQDEIVPEESYPHGCLEDVDTAECEKLCQKYKPVQNCYADQVKEHSNETLENLQKYWSSCSYNHRGWLRCIDVCQTDPEYIICYSSKVGSGCKAIKEFPMAFFDDCTDPSPAVLEECISSGIKAACKKKVDKMRILTTDSNKIGIDPDGFIKTDGETYMNSLTACENKAKSDYDSLKLTTTEQAQLRNSFFDKQQEYWKEECVKGKGVSTTKDEDDCTAQTAVRTCERFCPRKYEVLKCLDECAAPAPTDAEKILYKATCETEIRLKLPTTTSTTDPPVPDDVDIANCIIDKRKTKACDDVRSDYTTNLNAPEKCDEVKPAVRLPAATPLPPSLSNASPSTRNKCSSRAYYATLLGRCLKRCDNKLYANATAVEEKRSCKVFCENWFNYDEQVKGCNSFSIQDVKVFNNTWNVDYPTPEECFRILSKLSPPIDQDHVDVAEYIKSECQKSVPNNEFCDNNPRRVAVFQMCIKKLPTYLQDIKNSVTVPLAYIAIANCEVDYYQRDFDTESCKTTKTRATFDKVSCLVKCHTAHKEANINEKNKGLRCPNIEKPHVSDLTNFANCRWKLQFAYAKEPYIPVAHYFNERNAIDIEERLKQPQTAQYLEKTTMDDSHGYFVYPYYLIIQDECEEGYNESFHRLILHGGYPLVAVQHTAVNNRETFRTAMKIKFRTALINLNKTDVESKAASAVHCHKRLCHPAFAAPLVFLHIPIFEIVVSADDVFEELSTTIYVSSFHSRTATGEGRLEHARGNSDGTHPYIFFPKEREKPNTDVAADEYDLCAKQLLTNCANLQDPEDIPLTVEDFIRPQFTYGNAPVVVFAGFYAPNLLIVGDPDMNKFTLLEWNGDRNDNTTVNRVFDDTATCTFDNGRPMYSFIDISDAKFPVVYYRVVYDKTVAYGKNSESRAIYDVISLEDRLLLITTDGLVVLYGTSFATVQSNRQWNSPESDKLRKCFKFVRSPQIAMMSRDVIVGVTFNQGETGNGKEEIWVGQLVEAGEPLEWTQIETGHLEADPNDSTNNDNVTEIEKICFKAVNLKMANREGILSRVDNWCTALDAAAVPTKINTIQVLVRMLLKYNVVSTAGSELKSYYFYILASYSVGGEKEGYSSEWNIDSLLPRTPCIVDHKESVATVLVHDLQYFKFSSDQTQNPGCTFQDQSGGGSSEDALVLGRMTYTRMLSNHMYLYGSKLLHSTDGGESFVILRDFPSKPDDARSQQHKTESNEDWKKRLASHYIMVMAFDKAGHFAFLTNRRELWYGSTGELSQQRLRPSPAYSMTQTVVGNIPGFQDAVPFTVMFDSKDNLFEMVSVVREDQVTYILKRPVLVSQILQNKYFDESLKKGRDYIKDKSTSTPPFRNPRKDEGKFHPVTDLFLYPQGIWELFCPYNSPTIQENYTQSYRRQQTFFLRPPIQHPNLGNFFTKESLFAYQVASFGVVYKSLFDTHHEEYSRVFRDPIDIWKSEKKTAARIGYLNWILGDSSQHGIVVDPENNIRDFSDHFTNRERYYFLDYGIAIKYEMEFTIKNEASFASTDYNTQNIGLIQLNVDNANGSILKVNTEKIRKAGSASVQFIIYMELNPLSKLPQSLPGENIFQIPVVFNLIGGFGKCFKSTGRDIDNSIPLVIMAGCLQSTQLMFDWNSTLHSIKFRDKKAHYGTGADCYNNSRACFFARHAVKLYFEIFDAAQQIYKPFTGRYTMRVVAGGYTEESLLKDRNRYSVEEQEAYNIPGVSDVSLIWTEWDETTHSKIKGRTASGKKVHGSTAGGESANTREVILQSGVSTIKWACHTLSPCARIAPTMWGETVYWFRIAISNRDVDNATLCLFEREFNILLYGIPPSPEIQLLVTILFCLLILSILYLLYYCCRSHKKVWRANKLKLYGWFQIVIDTFPKPLKDLTAAANTEEQAIRKAYIIGSIQGHLKIPDLSEKTMQELEKGGQPPWAKDKTDLGQAYPESIRSEASSIILPAVNPRTGAGTWTDLVYEQIITKRLQAIVEKNKQMREGILRKVDLSRMKESLEHEERFQSEHGAKASAETAYQPPRIKKAPPKDGPGPSQK